MWSTVAEMVASGAPAPVSLVRADGGKVALPVERWKGPVSAGEQTLLARALPPVLDIGCGPGRVPAYLAARGLPALGIDVATDAIRLARGRGANALRRSVFGPVPRSGRWATAVLLDGNLGIGGDPEALLVRVRWLLRPGGRVLAEVEPPGVATQRHRVRLLGCPGGWRPWAQVGADDLPEIAAAAGYRMTTLEQLEGRWFAQLQA